MLQLSPPVSFQVQKGEPRHEDRRLNRFRLALAKRVALVVSAPRVCGLVGILVAVEQVIDRVLMRVCMQREDEVRIRAHGESEVRRKVGHLTQQAGLEKEEVMEVVDTEVAVSAD